MGLTAAQRISFAQCGFLRLPRAFSEAAAGGIAERIWRRLRARHGIRADDPSTWTIRQPTGFQSLTAHRVFAPMAGTATIDALDALIGTGRWHSAARWGAPLVTFPETDATWDVPQRQWHLDFIARGSPDALCGMRLLALVVGVEAQGGGTVVVRGSHHLVARLVESRRAGTGHSARVRDTLAAAYPWFRALWSRSAEKHERLERFMVDGACIDGIDVRVEELTGAPGDVILVHPWTFHAPAPNCGGVPRFAVSHSVFRVGEAASQ